MAFLSVWTTHALITLAFPILRSNLLPNIPRQSNLKVAKLNPTKRTFIQCSALHDGPHFPTTNNDINSGISVWKSSSINQCVCVGVLCIEERFHRDSFPKPRWFVEVFPNRWQHRTTYICTTFSGFCPLSRGIPLCSFFPRIQNCGRNQGRTGVRHDGTQLHNFSSSDLIHFLVELETTSNSSPGKCCLCSLELLF